ncbi:hypothetical protein ACQ4PT_032173 [Festuca glaucescens]
MAARRGGAFALVALCMFELALRGAGAGEPLVPAMFVLGDSTVDVGNNNFLPGCSADCRANYPRYGVDYTSHEPTGRFSNGYNLADHIGILVQCGQVHSMSDQLDRFASVVQMMGNCSYDLVSRSLVFISVGSNDLFEYAGSNATSCPNRNDTGFLQGLVASYRIYLQALYATGARKFSIVSPSLVGCCPLQRFAGWLKDDLDGYYCFGTANNLSRQLYRMLLSMLQDLSVGLAGMNYSICDSAAMADSVFNSTVSSPNNMSRSTGCSTLTYVCYCVGIVFLTVSFLADVLDTGCCGGSGLLGPAKCDMSATLCPNRAAYLFWDGFHPTETASAVAALALFADPGRYVHPINITRLAAL